MGNCFGYGKEGHKVRYCPNLRIQDKGSVQDQASSASLDDPKRNHFYALCSRGEQQESPHMVTSMLQAFSIVVYVLLDPIDTLSFLTHLVSKSFMLYAIF